MQSKLPTSLVRRPRSDSPLRRLPPERQQQIIASLETRSQKDVLAELFHTDHIEVSSAVLCRFRRWYLKRSQALDELILTRLQSIANQCADSLPPTPAADPATPPAPADSQDGAQSPTDSSAAPAPDGLATDNGQCSGNRAPRTLSGLPVRHRLGEGGTTDH